MRLHLLVSIFITFVLLVGPGAPAAAARPTPTIKACHVCEDVVVPATATATLPPAVTAEPETARADGTTPVRFDGFKPAADEKIPVVRAVLFWMDSCPHCHYVLDEVLPPLQGKYGRQLDIVLVEVTSEKEWNWLVETGASFGLPADRLGVPFMVIGSDVLMGSQQIPEFLPLLIEQHLAAGGLDYPQVAGLAEVLPPPPGDDPAVCGPATPCADEETNQAQDVVAPEPVAQGVAGEPSAVAPVAPPAVAPYSDGFGLALAIMGGMVLALAYSGVAVGRDFSLVSSRRLPAWLDLAIPVLTIAGMGVAGYLSYVETQAVAAVCGPVGDCNAVQSSPYATLFGVLPVGVLGLIGYVAILAAWGWWRFGAGRLASYAPLAMFGMALVGVLFSLYLTYLEPFVIGAACIWCLTSAVIITLLMLLSLGPLRQAVQTGTEEIG